MRNYRLQIITEITGNNVNQLVVIVATFLEHWSPSVLRSQALCEQKQNYELDLAQARAKYEEEATHVKEDEAKVLEEFMEKHRVQLESAHNAAEREKTQLVNVRARIIRKQMFWWAENKDCTHMDEWFIVCELCEDEKIRYMAAQDGSAGCCNLCTDFKNGFLVCCQNKLGPKAWVHLFHQLEQSCRVCAALASGVLNGSALRFEMFLFI